MKKALFPGTFNPPTLGHLEIIQRAGAFCDKLYVAIAETESKPASAFTIEEKISLLRTATKPFSYVEVIHFSGLTVDCAKELKADILVRGLRNGSDFDYEYQLALSNRQMTGIETVFLGASPHCAHISATLVREIAKQGRRLHGFVPESIEEAIFSRLSIGK